MGVLDTLLVTLCVGETVPDRAGDIIDLVSERGPSGVVGDVSVIGSRVNRVNLEKIPFLGSH